MVTYSGTPTRELRISELSRTMESTEKAELMAMLACSLRSGEGLFIVDVAAARRDNELTWSLAKL